jgi:hypothetical protein
MIFFALKGTRSAGTKKMRAGTGLGLYSVKFVEKHNVRVGRE